VPLAPIAVSLPGAASFARPWLVVSTALRRCHQSELIAGWVALAINAYKLVETVVNTVVRLVPTVPITMTAATAINAAINPYSIAVTPLRSFINANRALFSTLSLSTTLAKNIAMLII
jgi:hypothetical protein